MEVRKERYIGGGLGKGLGSPSYEDDIWSYKNKWALWENQYKAEHTVSYPQEAGKPSISNQYRRKAFGGKKVDLICSPILTLL